MNFRPILAAAALAILAACNGSSSTSSIPPGGSGMAKARFVDGAPALEAIINGLPQNIGLAYLQVDGQTVTTTFDYGSISTFSPIPAGTHSLVALDDLGYRVGPLKTGALSAGKRYTLVVVGSYPNYRVLTFEEPSGSGAQLSLYEASPKVPNADFGSFTASHHSNFKKLGSAAFGSVATVALGKSVNNFGGYAGKGTTPFYNGALTAVQLNGFDKHNVLPFHNAARMSLFVFDQAGSAGPVFGSLDQ